MKTKTLGIAEGYPLRWQVVGVGRKEIMRSGVAHSDSELGTVAGSLKTGEALRHERMRTWVEPKSAAQHTAGFEPRYGKMEGQETGSYFIIRQKSNGAIFAKTYSRVDAQVIAAAPDLLAALKRVKYLLAVESDSQKMFIDEIAAELKEARSVVRAAIAKAEGRA